MSDSDYNEALKGLKTSPSQTLKKTKTEVPLRERQRATAKRLDFLGWSSTVPDEDETWEAHAWPPLTDKGRITAPAKKQHASLYRLGKLGPLHADEEGAPVAKITG